MKLKFRTADQFRADGDGMSTDAVRAERDAVFARMKFLTRSAHAESRDLTADEAREFRGLTDVVSGLGDLLDSTKLRPSALVSATPMYYGDGRTDADGNTVVARSDGGSTEYRSGVPLTEDQSFAGFTRSRELVTAEAESISLRKLLKGAVTGEWRGADVERRALSEGTLSAGGYMLPSLVSSQIIDLARNKARVMMAGATVVPMSERTLLVPKWTTDQTAIWHTESAAIAPSDPVLGAVTLTAHTMASLVVVSRELIEDTGTNFDQQLQNAFAAKYALTLDLAALYGTGTDPEPRGVKNTTAVVKTPMGTNGAAPTSYDFVIDAVGRLADANEEPTAIIYSARTARELAKMKDSTGQPLETPEYVAALPRYDTNQVGNAYTVGTGTTTSDMFVADWSQLLVGIRTSLQIQVLDQRYADVGQIGFLAWFRGDVAVGRAAAFDVTTGIL